MNMHLNSRYLNESAQLVNRWGKVGLLEGIRDKWDRSTTAVLLENQRLINEQSTDTGDIAQFKRISIPLVRRIYPQLIANKIVSVQPLLGPTGLVYYLRFRYSTNKGATRGATQPGFPGDDALSLQQLASGDANLDIWYSHQFVSNETQANGGGSPTLQYQLEHSPILAGTMTGSAYVSGTLVQTFVVNSSNQFTFTNVGSPSNLIASASVNLVTSVVTANWVNGSSVPTDPTANSIIFNYEYNLEAQQDLPEINLVVESEDIVAITRKLKAVWTYEAQQDLRSQHNLDAEAELTAVLAQEINLEIDREVLTDLRNNAGTVSAWDFNTALGDTIKEKYESLYVKIVELSNVIHRKTLRGGANWLVTSPEVASIFETATAGFAPTMSDTFTSSLGIQYVGTINSKWRLYKDPLFPTGQILFGYKGDSYMDSGYFYCPYVPLTQTPTVLDPDSFTPRKGLMTRYGKKLLREGAKFYGRMSIANFVI
jgi:Major capsid protein Gp23